MAAGASSDGAAAVLRCPVPLWSRLKFLLLHLFCAIVVDLLPRLSRVFSGAWRRTQTTRVYGSPDATAFFKLDRQDRRPYVDPPYSGHVGTILCAFRPHRALPYERVVHPSADGNPMCVDWLMTDARTAKGVFIIIPGLASSSSTNYIEHFVWFAAAHHFHCAVFNSRGMGDTPIETPRLMSARWTDDLRAVLHDGPLSRTAIEARCGTGLRVVGVGFSLGGVILSRYVAEECLESRSLGMDAVMIVNSPLDCLASNACMNSGISKALYQPSMAGGLAGYARRHARVLKDLPGLAPEVRAAFAAGRVEEVLAQVKTVHDFDRVITAPTLGFATPEDYYHNISPIQWLPHISVPVLCISAVDDPVVAAPPMAGLASIMESNPNLALLCIPHGGHLGYVRGVWDEFAGTETFVERVIFEVAAAVTPRC
ncbi:Alpha/beta hydrolase family [Novymonas esmeraldas]|uniref:Alpha/beta hydrolase family n=1 Tax=Novymonas esmeraldas TaxID=1808958 RepID=A0AAW0F4B8_9TRYP